MTTATTRPKGLPITINEDDAFNHKLKSIRGRAKSMPETMFDFKSIMKFKTLDASLHSTYESGTQSENGSQGESNRLKWDKIIIREYSRTIGDNPSCSSGPPLR